MDEILKQIKVTLAKCDKSKSAVSIVSAEVRIKANAIDWIRHQQSIISQLSAEIADYKARISTYEELHQNYIKLHREHYAQTKIVEKQSAEINELNRRYEELDELYSQTLEENNMRRIDFEAEIERLTERAADYEWVLKGYALMGMDGAAKVLNRHKPREVLTSDDPDKQVQSEERNR